MNDYLSMITLSNFNDIEIMFLIYLSIINLIAFSMMGIDKRRAQNKEYRIREDSLMGVSLIGGAVGILIGMIVYKHKTGKKQFYVGVPIIYIINQISILLIFNHIK